MLNVDHDSLRRNLLTENWRPLWTKKVAAQRAHWYPDAEPLHCSRVPDLEFLQMGLGLLI